MPFHHLKRSSSHKLWPRHNNAISFEQIYYSFSPSQTGLVSVGISSECQLMMIILRLDPFSFLFSVIFHFHSIISWPVFSTFLSFVVFQSILPQTRKRIHSWWHLYARALTKFSCSVIVVIIIIVIFMTFELLNIIAVNQRDESERDYIRLLDAMRFALSQWVESDAGLICISTTTMTANRQTTEKPRNSDETNKTNEQMRAHHSEQNLLLAIKWPFYSTMWCMLLINIDPKNFFLSLSQSVALSSHSKNRCAHDTVSRAQRGAYAHSTSYQLLASSQAHLSWHCRCYRSESWVTSVIDYTHFVFVFVFPHLNALLLLAPKLCAHTVHLFHFHIFVAFGFGCLGTTFSLRFANTQAVGSQQALSSHRKINDENHNPLFGVAFSFFGGMQ